RLPNGRPRSHADGDGPGAGGVDRAVGASDRRGGSWPRGRAGGRGPGPLADGRLVHQPLPGGVGAGRGRSPRGGVEGRQGAGTGRAGEGPGLWSVAIPGGRGGPRRAGGGAGGGRGGRLPWAGRGGRGG